MEIQNKHILVFDISLFAMKAFHVHAKEDMEILNGMGFHTLLNISNKLFNKFKPDIVVMACDSKNWRGAYTRSSKCLSGRIYKGDRGKNKSLSDLERLKEYKEALHEFENILGQYSKIVHLKMLGLEADDLIAQTVYTYSEHNKVTICSSDKDFVQLLINDNVKLFVPVDEKYRTLDEWGGNRAYEMFLKTIRAGEDNIGSAFPRVRKTRLLKAWNDPVEMTNLMEHKWSDHRGVELSVRQRYEENNLLMDLTKQPEGIKSLMVKTVEEAFETHKTFDMLKFARFFKEKGYPKLTEDMPRFANMLNTRK
jgi:hypothetical protein